MAQPNVYMHTDTMITVQWAALTGVLAGNSAILSYDLYWDNASGQTIYNLDESLNTNFTVQGLQGGKSY